MRKFSRLHQNITYPSLIYSNLFNLKRYLTAKTVKFPGCFRCLLVCFKSFLCFSVRLWYNRPIKANKQRGKLQMKEFTVCLDTIARVKNFVNLVNRFDNDFDLCAGRYIVEDRKSVV